MSDYNRFPEQDADLESGDMFARPVAVPAPNIDEAPLKCLAVNEEYAKIIALALERMLYHDAWTGTDADVQRVTQQVEHIIGQLLTGDCLGEPCPQPTEPGCVELPAFSPSIEYFYNHPVLTPDAIAPGWDRPMWITGEGLEPLYTADDALLDNSALLNFADYDALLSSGVPSLTLNVSGEGEIDITFLLVPLGGLAVVIVDGGANVDVVSLDLIDLTTLFTVEGLLLLLGLGVGEQSQEMVHSVDLVGAGPHTLSIYFIPDVELASWPPLQYGGGLRNVQLCGPIIEETETVMPYNLVLNGCALTLELDGVPVNTVQVMTPVPDCHFQSTVDIDVNEFNIGTSLQLNNLYSNPGDENTGAALYYRAPDANQQMQDIARIQAHWGTKSLDRTMYDFYLYDGGVQYNVLRLASKLAMAVRVDDALGRAGIRIIAYNQSVKSGVYNLAVQNDAENRYMFRQNGTGMVEIERSNPYANYQTDAMRFYAFADGVIPTTGFGSSLRFRSESSTIEAREQARIVSAWANATDANRSGRLQLRASDYSGEQVGITVEADGVSKLGFHGEDALPKPVITGTSEYAALTSLIQGLHDIGFVYNGTNFLPDSGSPALMPSKNIVTEIYHDYEARADKWQVFVGGDYGTYTPGSGYTNLDDGLRLYWNQSPQSQICELRFSFYLNVSVDTELGIYFDLSQSYETEIWRETFNTGGVTMLFQRSVPVFYTTETAAPLSFWTLDNRTFIGDIVVLAGMDVSYLGLPIEESTEVIPYEQKRLLRYVDLSQRPYAWGELAHGLSLPEGISFEAQ